MGVLSNLAGQIAKMFAGSPEQRILRLTAGNISDDGGLMGGYATLQQFGASRLGEYLRLDAGLIERYTEAEFMDEYPELASALDIYADDATQPDLQTARTIWATSPKPNIERELNRMLVRISADDHNWEMSRATAKYGDDYEELLIDGSGVIGLHYLPPITVRRIEGRYGELYGFLQDPRGGINLTVQDWQRAMSNRSDISQQYLQPDQMIAFEPWEVAHFRLRTKYRQSKTGQSILEPARWIWRRLVLLEDCAMVYRLHRAPERLQFSINVGSKDGLEAQAVLNRYRQMYRKKRFVNPATGKLEMRFEQLSQDDDIYLAFQEGKDPSTVNLLSAPQWQCLVGSTVIPLLDGTAPTIQALAERGGAFGVFAATPEGRIVPGYGHSARITHEAAEIWEVTLDNKQVISCTGNHPFLTRDGRWVPAAMLEDGELLMPMLPFPMPLLQGMWWDIPAESQRLVTFVRKTDRIETVYDLTVDDLHCFAIGQGVIVHNSVDDLDYFKQKLYAAIKIPSAYMGDPDGVVRNVLSQQDIRFARSVMRLQRAMRDGWGQVCDVHLAALGIPVDRDKFPYELHMTAPSSIIELAQLEAKSARADLAARMGDFVSLHWILSNVFNMSDTEIQTIFTQRHADQIRDGKTQAEVQELMQPEGGDEQAYEGVEYYRMPRDARRASAAASARRIGWKLPSVRQAEMRGRGPRAITEAELFKGSKEAERRARDVIAKLMDHDKAFAGRIHELSALLHEMRGVRAGGARGSR